MCVCVLFFGVFVSCCLLDVLFNYVCYVAAGCFVVLFNGCVACCVFWLVAVCLRVCVMLRVFV